MKELNSVFEGSNWQTCLPSSLSESHLLGLTLDMRHFEAAEVQPTQTAPNLAGPLYTVLRLLMEHPATKPPSGKLSLPEETVWRSLKVYQWGLEREIVNRIIGVGGETDRESLIDAMTDTSKASRFRRSERGRR
ncbi:MAG TPA: hypothetical protein VN663_10200 [Ramlibacter sp.]|nr:hypothetical protein [Ramlibacter sp.]